MRANLRQEDACEELNNPLWKTLHKAGIGLCEVNKNGRFTFDDETAARFGIPPKATFRSIIRKIARPSRQGLVDMARALQHLPQQRSPDLLCYTASGTEVWMRAIAHRSEDLSHATHIMVTLVDITSDRKELMALRESEEHLRYTVQYNPQLPWAADPHGRIIEVTDRWLDITKMSRDAVLGTGWLNVTHPDDLPAVREQIMTSIETGAPFDVRTRLLIGNEYRWMRAQGYPRRDEHGNIIRWYGYTEDIHEHTLAEEQIRWNAEHDLLTGLANRAVFNARLEAALASALQNLSRVGILLVDIDHFKEVNDLLGHHVGDEMLSEFAKQLKKITPENALVARFGSDEFAILLPHISGQTELLDCAEQILAIRQRTTTGADVDYRASVGASLYPDHGQNPSELLRHADIALFAAKEGGRGKCMIFQEQMQRDIHERSAMVSRARTAAESGDIIAFYQPKVSLKTGELIGFEALLRWRDSRNKIQSPSLIAAAFEDPGVADLLGEVMLNHIVTDIKAWEQAGLAYGHVALNAAPAEFRQGGFASRLIKTLNAAGLKPEAVEVEVTEGVFLGSSAEHAVNQINQLHNFGTRLALDDFGTGFASLSHLRTLPVDTLKIDRSFISKITSAHDDRAIVSAITSLGHSLGIKVIAEGIETREQADALRECGCEFAQGFYFGVPTPAHEIPTLINNWGSKTLARNIVTKVA